MKSSLALLISLSLAAPALAHPCNEAWGLQRNEFAKALEKDLNPNSRDRFERLLSGGYYFDPKKSVRVFYQPKQVEASTYFLSLIEMISRELGFPSPILTAVPEEADIYFVMLDDDGLTHPESMTAISAYQPDKMKRAKLLAEMKDTKSFGIKYDESPRAELSESSRQHVSNRLVTIKAVDGRISTLALNATAAWAFLGPFDFAYGASCELFDGMLSLDGAHETLQDDDFALLQYLYGAKTQ